MLLLTTHKSFSHFSPLFTKKSLSHCKQRSIVYHQFLSPPLKALPSSSLLTLKQSLTKWIYISLVSSYLQVLHCYIILYASVLWMGSQWYFSVCVNFFSFGTQRSQSPKTRNYKETKRGIEILLTLSSKTYVLNLNWYK